MEDTGEWAPPVPSSGEVRPPRGTLRGRIRPEFKGLQSSDQIEVLNVAGEARSSARSIVEATDDLHGHGGPPSFAVHDLLGAQAHPAASLRGAAPDIDLRTRPSGIQQGSGGVPLAETILLPTSMTAMDVACTAPRSESRVAHWSLCHFF